MAHDQAGSDERLAARISGDVERLYLDKFGKGPLHTETFISGDVVTTVLRDVFTPVEKVMVADGKEDAVLATRMQWQRATDSLFCSLITEATGRPVLATVSGFDAGHDLATEVFLLAAD